MRRINFKLLLLLVIGVVVLVGGTQLVHVIQARRNASKLLAAAKKSEEAGHLDRAATYLDRYLYFLPNDTEVLSRYAAVLGKMPSAATREKAIFLLEKALRNDPTRTEDRRTLASFALDLSRYSDARAHATALLADNANDGVGAYVLGRCLEADKEYPSAEVQYRSAIRNAPSDPRAYIQLATLLRTRLDKPRDADHVMNRLVAANGRSFRAHLARSRYRSIFKLPGAQADARRAVELAPEDADALWFAAICAGDAKDWTRARDFMERGLKHHPQEQRMYLGLADIELAVDHLDAAVAVLARGADTLPGADQIRLRLARVWVDRGKFLSAGEVIKTLVREGYEPEQLKILQARIAMGLQDWGKAIADLEAVQPVVASKPILSRQVDSFLAEGYERLRKVEELKAVYRRLIATDPTSGQIQLAYGRALEVLGRDDEAEQHYRDMVVSRPAAKLALARLLIRRNAALPASRQHWDDVIRTLDDAQREATGPANVAIQSQVAIQRADVRVKQGNLAAAQAELERARLAQPEQLEAWLALATVLARRGSLDAIGPLLDAADRKFGDRVDLRLARASYISRRGGAGATKALDDLERGLADRPAGEQDTLLRGLANAHLVLGDRAGALSLWGKLVALRPDDVSLHTQMFAVAAVAGDDAAMQGALDQLRRIEGATGPDYGLVRASYLLNKARGGDKSHLDEARRLLKQVAAQRPGAPRVILAMAQVEELSGDPGAALSQYVQAIEAGERDPAVLRETLDRLHKAHRFADAGKVLAKLQDQPLLSDEFQRYAAEISVRNRDFDQALGLAQKAVSDDSKDYGDHMWLGQVLAASGRQAEAERHLRRAVGLAGLEPAPRIVLVAFLMSNGQKPEAEEAVRQAEATLLPEKQLVPLARCHDLVGHTARALELYRAAQAAAPDDEPALRNLIDFLVKYDRLRDVEPLLEHLIALRPADAPALKRLLAKVLSAQRDPERAKKALAMVSEVSQDPAPGKRSGPLAAAEIRDRVVVLTNFGDEVRRKEAIGLLEGLVTREQDPRDRIRLAQLYEEQGDWPKAREALLTVVRANDKVPDVLVVFIQALIRHGEAEQAGAWVATLEKLEPRGLPTAQLKALRLKTLGQTVKAVAVLEEYASRDDAQIVTAALTAEKLELFAPAEALFKKAGAKDPTAQLALAAFLGRRERIAEGLDVCEACWKTCKPDLVAGVCMNLIGSPKADAAQRGRVQRWIEEALAKQPGDQKLLLSLGGLRYYQESYSASEAAYRQALAQDASAWPIMNNLAWLLAHEKGKEAEALALIDRAVTAGGRRPALLDTRGVIHLNLGHVPLAIQDLEDAVAGDPQTPAKRFHLAQAYHAAGRRADASVAIDRAIALGLEPANLDPLERPAYERLAAELKKK